MFMGNKSGRVVSIKEELPSMHSQDPLISWRFRVIWQIEFITWQGGYIQ